MNHTFPPKTTQVLRLFDRLMRRLALRSLRQISDGKLEVRDGEAISTFGKQSSFHATVNVRDPRFYRQLLFGGSLAASEAFVRGEWDCDDLTTLFRLLVRNQAAGDDLDGLGSRLSRWIYQRVHRWHANTKGGSRDNIRAHYDLGNEFFRLWLDDTWAYSCGIFSAGTTTLHDASLEKCERVCRKLDLRGDDHLLEIGAGWGGLAMHAAENFGCRVTTTTISREQFELANQRIQAAGLSGQINLLLQDYRDLAGRFDKLVSIEMIEAVGHEYLDTYFAQCSKLLKPQGSLLLQAIVMPERGYQQYLRSVDFIRRYIFPGGCLPSVSSILDSVGRTSRLRLVHLEDMAPHYAETLRRWRANLHDRLDDVRRLGYPDEFIRLWNYYLCYCEAAFEERYVGVVQMVFDNHACQRDPLAIATSVPERSHRPSRWDHNTQDNFAACLGGRPS
jgi:cyclopropane-fatty-acyl-phospholipid synthase